MFAPRVPLLDESVCVCVCACFFVDPTCFLIVEKIRRKSLFAKVSDLPRLGSY